MKLPTTVWVLATSCLVLMLSDHPRPVQTKVTLDKVATVFKLGNVIMSGITVIWNILDDGGPEHPFFAKKDKEILKQMQQLSQQLTDSEHQILNTVELSMGNMIKQLASDIKLEQNLRELADLMHRIGERERLMRSYVNSGERLERHTLETFASSTVAHDVTGVSELLSRIDLLVSGSSDLPFGNAGLLRLMYQATKEDSSTMCRFGLSGQQMLYQLYNAIAITELKGYSMIQFSWMLLKAYGKGNFSGEAKLMHGRFRDRINRTQLLLLQLMQQTSRDYWRCDPDWNQQKEGETYLQFTRLLQGYVANEISMNRTDYCSKDCAYYSSNIWQGECSLDKPCSEQQKCSGKISGCKYIDSDMWICPASRSSNRRYEYIEYENGIVLGQKKRCARGTTKVDSWWAKPPGFFTNHCSYCFCLCDDGNMNSDRFISLRESVSNVKNNMVVTGMRFVKKNRIIHLIVQQGRLLPHGEIDNSTLEWVQAEDYSMWSSNVHEGRDYHTLNYNNRFLDLDDLDVPQGYVLTGVRFRLLFNHLYLKIRMTKIDIDSGRIIDADSNIWIASDTTEHIYDRRTELELDHPHVPLLSPSKSIPDSSNNQFIRFRESDREMDAAQTTVPFFDAQPVVPTKPVPLSGAGLFHKGQPKFGGYIAPKVKTYDLSSLVQGMIEEKSETTQSVTHKPWSSPVQTSGSNSLVSKDPITILAKAFFQTLKKMSFLNI